MAFMARDYLRSLIPIGDIVTVSAEEISNQKRLLGQIFYHNQDINSEMIKSGYAVPYFIYPFDNKMVDTYLNAAHQAIQDQVSIFTNKANTQVPYLFRLQVSGARARNHVANYFTKQLYPAEMQGSILF